MRQEKDMKTYYFNVSVLSVEQESLKMKESSSNYTHLFTLNSQSEFQKRLISWIIELERYPKTENWEPKASNFEEKIRNSKA